jgi:hypothetical protein
MKKRNQGQKPLMPNSQVPPILMRLQDFVATALSDIVGGVAIAQAEAAKSGALISPALEISGVKEETVFYYYDNASDERRYATKIEFEVAVTTKESGEAKCGVGLFTTAIGLGVQAQIGGGGRWGWKEKVLSTSSISTSAGISQGNQQIVIGKKQNGPLIQSRTRLAHGRYSRYVREHPAFVYRIAQK